MDIVSYSELRKNLAHSMDKVVADRNPLIITRQNAEATVLMSLKDYNAYEETAYLLSSPANAERLRRSIAEAQAGRLVHKELINDEAEPEQRR